MTKTNNIIAVIALVVVLAFAATLGIQRVYGVANTVDTSASADRYRDYQFFTRTWNQNINFSTTTLTSTGITSYFDANGRLVDGTLDIRGAKAVNFAFKRGETLGGGNTGSSLFTVEVTVDGSIWIPYSDLVNVAATTTANITHQASATLTGTSTAIYTMATLGFAKVRCIVTETTDGEHTCEAAATY